VRLIAYLTQFEGGGVSLKKHILYSVCTRVGIKTVMMKLYRLELEEIVSSSDVGSRGETNHLFSHGRKKTFPSVELYS
jgi:hypothetical protein